MERHLYPNLHQELCEDQIRKMAKTGRANFSVFFRNNLEASIIPKEPYERLHMITVKNSANRSVHQSADGHWIFETNDTSIESIARQLPNVISECYPNAVSGIKAYSLFIAQNKPQVITVKAA